MDRFGEEADHKAMFQKVKANCSRRKTLEETSETTPTRHWLGNTLVDQSAKIAAILVSNSLATAASEEARQFAGEVFAGAGA